jgi:DHA2 family multidrug resistance protein
MASEVDVANRIPITAALILATLMYTIDSTIANVALPHIQGSVSAAQDQITWVLTSYIIATAIMTPLSGWLSLKIGRKRMLLISIAAFTVASMLCGVATTLPEIVAFRLFQGVAGASLMPLSQNVMLDVFPLEKIPQVMSIWSAAVIMGPIFGPALGGWLTDNLSWRWVFYINLPIGVLAFMGVYTFMDADPGGKQRPFDFLGFGALVTFIGAFQLLVDRGPSQDWFSSPEIWIETGIAVIGLYVFIVQTLTAEHPFFHRDLAADRNFVTTTLFGFFVGMLLFSTTALLPTLMQNLMGYSVLQSGYASMPRGVGSFVAFLMVPHLMARIGARPVLLIGMTLSIVGLWQMSYFDLAMTAMPIVTSGFIQGFGIGLIFSPLATLAYVTLAPEHRTEGTIVNTLVRSLGSSVGISAMQAMLVRISAASHSSLAERVQPADPVFRAALPPFFDPASAAGASALNAEVTRQASMIAYDGVFHLMFVMTLLMLPLLLILRSPRIGGAPPIETVAD